MPPELLESILGALEDMGRAIQELQQGSDQFRQEVEQGFEQLQQQIAQSAQPPLADPSMMGGQGDPDANAQMGEGQPQKTW